jgi:hypothetical protein
VAVRAEQAHAACTHCTDSTDCPSASAPPAATGLSGLLQCSSVLLSGYASDDDDDDGSGDVSGTSIHSEDVLIGTVASACLTDASKQQ